MHAHPTLVELAKALASLKREAVAEMRLAEDFACAAQDAKRWGLRTEAEIAAFHFRRLRVSALICAAKAVVARARLTGSRG